MLFNPDTKGPYCLTATLAYKQAPACTLQPTAFTEPLENVGESGSEKVSLDCLHGRASRSFSKRPDLRAPHVKPHVHIQT